jgi:hypothetical protein
LGLERPRRGAQSVIGGAGGQSRGASHFHGVIFLRFFNVMKTNVKSPYGEGFFRMRSKKSENGADETISERYVFVQSCVFFVGVEPHN